MIPDAARKEEEAGEAIRKQMYGEDSKDIEGTLEDTPALKVEATPDLDEAKEDLSKEDTALEDEATPDLKDKGAAEDDKAGNVDWEQKCKVITGKYDAEVPRLQLEVKYHKDEVTARDAKILVLEQAAKDSPKKDDTGGNPPNLTAAMEVLEAELGGDVAEAVKAVIAGNAPAADNTMGDRMSKVEQDTEVQADINFRQSLTGLVPNWKVLNDDRGFLDWLEEFDPVAGKSYGAAVDEAYANKDAVRAAAIFNLFPAPKAGDGKKGKQTPNLAPDKGSKGGQIPKTEDLKYFTGKEVERFYADVQKGLYKTRPNMQKKLEAEINLAANEHRIRG